MFIENNEFDTGKYCANKLCFDFTNNPSNLSARQVHSNVLHQGYSMTAIANCRQAQKANTDIGLWFRHNITAEKVPTKAASSLSTSGIIAAPVCSLLTAQASYSALSTP